jgi:SNF2 family DNA or RNA helicase
MRRKRMISKEAIENLLNDSSFSELSMKYVKDISLNEWERLLPEKLYRLKTKPYKHQYACLYTGLLKDNFLFLCSMGLGKTKVILDIVSNKNPDNRVLILSPNILTVNVWADQIKEHSDLSYLELTGTIQDRWNTLLELKNREVSSCEKEVDLILLNYTGLLLMLTDEVKSKNGKNKWEINKKKLKQFSSYFNGIVFDEIHLMKNKDSLTYKLCNTLSDNCILRYGLTGTPMNRNPIDLWSIFHLIDKGKTLGETISLYREAFFTAKKSSWGFKKGRELYSVDYSFKKELESILKGRMETSSLRYSKEEALDLPKKVYIKRQYTLPEVNLSSYNEEKEFSDDSLEDVENKYIKRRQVCSGYIEYENEYGNKQFMEFDENPKLDLLMELINETEEDTKVVVALEYIKSGDIVCDRLKKEKIGFERIYGGTKDKIGAKNRFIDNPKCKVLVGNVKSIGIGLDGLQKVCSYLFIYESPPSNIDRQQLEDRLHRSGQKETTFIYDLVLEHKDSVEKKILLFLAEGKNYFSHIIDGRVRKNKNRSLK